MLQLGAIVAAFYIREGMRPAVRADQHRIALGIVAGVGGGRHDFDQPAIAVLAVSGGDPFRDDGRAGVLADMDHFGAGVRLLMAAGQRHRKEFADRVIAAQDAAGVFPGDGRAGFRLGP